MSRLAPNCSQPAARLPAALLRFENEWHGTESVPSNWLRTQLYMMTWFKKYGAKPVS